MTTDLNNQAITGGVIEALSDDKIVLKITGTDYQLHLVPTVPALEFGVAEGKRIKGTIQAKALRIHPANGGGCFIEPAYGAPRIVAGVVLEVDVQSQTVLVDVAIPMRVTLRDSKDLNICQVGELVNFYVESGTSFTPA